MAEQDPRKFRGGVHEPPDAKGGPDSWADNEGVVPREMIDEPPPEETGPQALDADVEGEVTDHDHADEAIDKSAGDRADATTFAGPGADPEELEKGSTEEEPPVSRVDQPNLAAKTQKGPRTG